MDLHPGDSIVTKPGLMWKGEDIGDRLGKVISTTGYILVNVYDCLNNPVKCFRYEVEKVELALKDEDIDELLEDLQDLFQVT